MRSKRVSKFRTKYLKKNTRKKSKTTSKRLKKNKVKRSKRSVFKGGSGSAKREMAEIERKKLDDILKILNTEKESKICDEDVCDLSVGETGCHTTSEFCRIFGDCQRNREGDEDDCFFYETELNRKDNINSFINKRINRLWEESLKEIKIERHPREYCLGIILLTPGFSKKIIDYLKTLESIKPRIETLESGKSPNEIIKYLFENYNNVDYFDIFSEIVIYLIKYTKKRNNNFIDIINDSADHIASMILNAPILNDTLLEATYLK